MLDLSTSLKQLNRPRLVEPSRPGNLTVDVSPSQLLTSSRARSKTPELVMTMDFREDGVPSRLP